MITAPTSIRMTSYVLIPRKISHIEVPFSMLKNQILWPRNRLVFYWGSFKVILTSKPIVRCRETCRHESQEMPSIAVL